MPSTLIFLLGAALLLLVAPLLLARAPWVVRYPRLALITWYGDLALGLFLTLIGLLSAVLFGTGVLSRGNAVDQAVDVAIAWAGLAAFGIAIAVLLSAADRQAQSADEQLTAHHSKRRWRWRRTVVLHIVNDPEPIACVLSGSRPTIMVTSAMRTALTTEQLEAVIAHEYAHIRHRHATLTRVAALNAAVLPKSLPAGRELARATALLIELAADDVAARRAGSDNLAQALIVIGKKTRNPAMRFRAERIQQIGRSRGRLRPLPRSLQLGL